MQELTLNSKQKEALDEIQKILKENDLRLTVDTRYTVIVVPNEKKDEPVQTD